MMDAMPELLSMPGTRGVAVLRLEDPPKHVPRVKAAKHRHGEHSIKLKEAKKP